MLYSPPAIKFVIVTSFGLNYRFMKTLFVPLEYVFLTRFGHKTIAFRMTKVGQEDNRGIILTIFSAFCSDSEQYKNVFTS